MKKNLFQLLLVLLLMALSVPSLAAVAPIDVIYNGSKLDIKPSPTIDNGRTLIPLRSIMENFGAKVTWNAEDRSILITQKNTSIWLQIDNPTAIVNGVSSQLDTTPKLISSRTFVPLRFISESLHLLVRWDSRNQTVYITDWTDTSTQPIILGTADDVVLKQLGTPKRIDKSIYGFDWYIYNTNYKTYQQIGIKNDQIVAQYGFDIQALTDQTLKTNMTRNEVRNSLGTSLTSILKGNLNYAMSSRHQDTYKVGASYYTCYFDSSPSQLLYAISIIDATTEESFRSYYATASSALAESYEKQVFDITNAFRALHNLPALSASTPLNTTAKSYSLDMGTRGYFSHTSPEGKTIKERILALFASYAAIGENIASGSSNAIQAVHCWINSPDHRDIILGNYDALGTGVYLGSGSKTYYTQHFILKGVIK